MNFVNLTEVNVTNALTGVSHPPSGEVARVSTSVNEVSPGFFETEFGEVENLPEPQEGVLLIVSGLVRSQVTHRGDVISPGALVRDEKGQPVGCRGFSVNPSFPS